MKNDLLNFTLHELEEFLISIGEKKYRAKQIFKWIYQRSTASFNDMSDIPVPLREKLENIFNIGKINIKEKKLSLQSDTIKYVYELSDEELIETVFIPEIKRRTLCVSTQVGCALGCVFCATGKLGLKRNLTAGEIVCQVLSVIKDKNENLTNIVYMGMGEPLLNYENVVKSVDILSDQNGFAIAPRRITISTIGIIPAIKRYADEKIKAKLAISLTAVSDEIRNKLMPVSKSFPIKELLQTAHYYTKKVNKKITFEYVLIDGINDSIEEAKKLAKLVSGISYKINLIPFNPIGNEYKKPSKENIDLFFRTLKSHNIQVNIRWSKGEDIQGACGQLVSSKNQ